MILFIRQAKMMIIDYHPRFQQIAFLVEETGEGGEQRLNYDGSRSGAWRVSRKTTVGILIGSQHAES